MHILIFLNISKQCKCTTYTNNIHIITLIYLKKYNQKHAQTILIVLIISGKCKCTTCTNDIKINTLIYQKTNYEKHA